MLPLNSYEKGLFGRTAKENVELYDKYGMDYKSVERFAQEVRSNHNSTLNPDSNLTTKAAEEYIQSKNLQGEFEKWLEGKSKEYGVKEVIFDGYTPSGKRKYVDNTLENASRLMKSEGRNGATGWNGSFNDFAARLMPSHGKLEEIRSKKGLLTNDHADLESFREKWGKVYTELGMKCQPDAKNPFDIYGMERLSEAATQKNPQQYLKEQYGIELSDADAKRLNEMIKAIKEEYPAMYFETKYERPVMFNEFASAVVPTTLKESTKEFLRKQGLTLYEYDKDIEGDRQRAFEEASSGEGIRFQKETENKFKTLRGEEAERELHTILSSKEAPKMPVAIDSLEKFKEIFSKPVRTILGKIIKVKDSVFKKIVRNNRNDISGSIMNTLEDADFVISDTDGSLLYVKRYLNENNEKIYNIAVVNKTGEFEDFVSSVHIKRNGNLLNKIKNGAELLLPNRRDGDGYETRNNSAPSGANLERNTESGKNSEGKFKYRTSSEIDAEYPNTSATDTESKANRAKEISEHLNTPVRVITSEEELAGLTPRQKKAKGWYNTATGEIVVVAPNNANVADVENTVLHEVIGHDGIRVLFPDEKKLNNALDELYRVSNKGIKDKIDTETQKMYDAEVDRIMDRKRKEHEAKGEDANATYYTDLAEAHKEASEKREQMRRDATEEYGADLAGRIGEEGFEKMTSEEKTFWGKIKSVLQEALTRLLDGLGIKSLKKWGDKEWAYIYHEAYKRKKNGGNPTVFDLADTAAMREKTGFGKEENGKNDIKFRNSGDDLNSTIENAKAKAERINAEDKDEILFL